MNRGIGDLWEAQEPCRSSRQQKILIIKDKAMSKIWKSIVSILAINSLLLGTSGMIGSASPQSDFYVTKGYKTTKSIVIHDLLSSGREWAIYDLNSKKYVGNATIAESRMVKIRNCSYSATKGDSVPENTVTLPRNLPNFENPLLIRPIPISPTTVEIKSIPFMQLPESFQQYFINSPVINTARKKEYLRNDEFTFITIDLNEDNLADVIYAYTFDPGSVGQNIYTRLDLSWTEKYKESCEGE
jgi:hypothetical protein